MFPKIRQRLAELGLADKTIVMAGGRIAEKEEEHAYYEEKIKKEGSSKLLGVDRFFGPGTDPKEVIAWMETMVREMD